MINQKIIEAVIRTAENNNKNLVISEIFDHIYINYDYNDLKANHVLEMLIDANSIVSVDDVDKDYILRHLKNFIYNYEENHIKDVTIELIDNIDCIVRISYKYLNKSDINTDKKYLVTYRDINFINNPEILIK